MAATKRIIYKDLETDEQVEDFITKQTYEQFLHLVEDFKIIHCDWEETKKSEFTVTIDKSTEKKIEQISKVKGINKEEVVEQILLHFTDEYIKILNIDSKLNKMFDSKE